MGFFSGLKILLEPKLVSAISPKNGEWIITSSFDTPKRAFLYDGETGSTIIISPKKNKNDYDTEIIQGLVSLFMLTYPEQQQDIPFTWDELIPGSVSTLEEAKKLLNSAGEIKYNGPIKKFEFSQIMIGTRSGKVKTIRRKEVHPLEISFMTKDAEFYTLIIQITTKVINPLKALQLKNFLNAIAIKVDEAITNWGRAVDFKTARTINADEGEKQITINKKYYRKVINDEFKEKYGIIIDGVDIVDFFPGDKSKARVESEQKIAQKENEAKQAEHESARRLKLLEATKQENQATITLAQGVSNAWADAVVKVNESQEKVVKAYGGNITYLNTSGNNNSLNFEDIMAAIELSNGKK